MKKTVILFDLDGTLTESGDGIVNSVAYALEQLGRPEPDIKKLQAFIGPPLVEQFAAYGLDPETAPKAVELYRERFRRIGIFENALYPGIAELLEDLSQKGLRISVASSKPEVFVCQILENFKIKQYFDEIVGSTLDESRLKKADVIEEALRRLHIGNDRSHVVMVGDKEHDIIGARQTGIPCIAVRYGYGTKEEIEAAEPWQIADTVEELKGILLRAAGLI